LNAGSSSTRIITGELSRHGTRAGTRRSPNSPHKVFRINYKSAESAVAGHGWGENTPVHEQYTDDVSERISELMSDARTPGEAAEIARQVADEFRQKLSEYWP
jgi:uncharacterized protein YoaH (UPF0181 family)